MKSKSSRMFLHFCLFGLGFGIFDFVLRRSCCCVDWSNLRLMVLFLLSLRHWDYGFWKVSLDQIEAGKVAV